MAGKGTIQAERLKSLIERIERLEEERAALTGDIREVYAEAKSAGYDTKVMRQIVRLRRMDCGRPPGAAGAARRLYAGGRPGG